MIDTYEVISKNRLARRYKLKPDSPEIVSIGDKITRNSLDFSSNTYRNYDGRLVTQFPELSPENVILLHLKHQLKRAFKVSFTNRNKIIDELFDKLRVVRSLQDFTIVKFDLKNYFYSISTEYVYAKYIQNSRLSRADKDYLDLICASNPYCVAGLPVFNYFVEMVSRDLDEAIRSRLSSYGLIYYARYVDDGIVVLNKYIPKKQFRKILDQTIEDVFQNTQSKNKVKISEKKFTVINRRHTTSDCSFDFLGYEFFIKSDFKTINIGITQRKQSKYQEKINKLVKDNYKPGHPFSEELVRHMIKAHSSRVVFYAPSAKHKGVWVSKGIIANYNRLKDYNKHIDRRTTKFLKEIYIIAFRNAGFTPPYYLLNSRYSLYANMMNNRAMIFNELIGTPQNVLLDELNKIGIVPRPDKKYDYLVKDYLIAVKAGY